MAGSYNRGYVKCTTADGIEALTTFVPVAAESKFLSLSTKVFTLVINSALIVFGQYPRFALSSSLDFFPIENASIPAFFALDDRLSEHIELLIGR